MLVRTVSLESIENLGSDKTCPTEADGVKCLIHRATKVIKLCEDQLEGAFGLEEKDRFANADWINDFLNLLQRIREQELQLGGVQEPEGKKPESKSGNPNNRPLVFKNLFSGFD